MITTRLPRAGVQRTPAGELTEARARGALDRAVTLLLSRQHPDGSWDDGQRVGLTAVPLDLLTRDLLGVLAPGHATLAAGLIRSRQRADGSWGQCPAGAPDRAATIACYLALRLAGDPADAYHMALAAGWLRDAGGLGRADLVTTLWLAACGLGPWPCRPVAPPEAFLLPGWVTRRLPGDRCRATIVTVPLAVIGSSRPTRRRRPFQLNEIAPAAAGRGHKPSPASRPGPVDQLAGQIVGRLAGQPASQLVDHLVGCWQRLVPVVPLLRHLRAAGYRRSAAWMVARQDPDGSWGRSEEATALCLIALGQLGRGAGHRAMARGLSWLDQQAGRSWHQAGRGERDLAAATTDTTRAVAALVAAGLPSGHQALTRAAAFLDGHPVPRRSPGPLPGALPGRPLARVVAAAVLALSRAGLAASPQARRGVVWLLRAQSADGSWPEGDIGDAIVTARVVLALVAAGVKPWKEPIARAARWLADQQLHGGHLPDERLPSGHLPDWPLPDGRLPDGRLPDGRLPDWPLPDGRLPDGRLPDGPLPDGPLPDGPLPGGLLSGQGGGWPAVPGYSPVPTVRATTAVVTALLACGNADSLACAERGVDWLASTQGDDGSWTGAPTASGVPPPGGTLPAGVPAPRADLPDGLLGQAEPGTGHGGPYLPSTCHAVEALSSYLRCTANSTAAGGYVAH